MHKAMLAVGMWAVAIPTPIMAQAVNVYVADTAEDMVGRRLIYDFRDQINRSSLLNLVYGDEAAIVAHIVTLDPQEEQYGQNYTVYSLVLTFRTSSGTDLFLTQSVGTCGVNKIDSCASGFIADIDKWADAVKKYASTK